MNRSVDSELCEFWDIRANKTSLPFIMCTSCIWCICTFYYRATSHFVRCFLIRTLNCIKKTKKKTKKNPLNRVSEIGTDGTDTKLSHSLLVVVFSVILQNLNLNILYNRTFSEISLKFYVQSRQSFLKWFKFLIKSYGM